MTSQGNHPSDKVGTFFTTYRGSSTNQWHLKKKVLKTMLDYKRLMKNKTKYNMWILLDCGLNTLVVNDILGKIGEILI